MADVMQGAQKLFRSWRSWFTDFIPNGYHVFLVCSMSAHEIRNLNGSRVRNLGPSSEMEVRKDARRD